MRPWQAVELELLISSIPILQSVLFLCELPMFWIKFPTHFPPPGFSHRFFFFIWLFNNFLVLCKPLFIILPQHPPYPIHQRWQPYCLTLVILTPPTDVCSLISWCIWGLEVSHHHNSLKEILTLDVRAVFLVLKYYRNWDFYIQGSRHPYWEFKMKWSHPHLCFTHPSVHWGNVK